MPNPFIETLIVTIGAEGMSDSITRRIAVPLDDDESGATAGPRVTAGFRFALEEAMIELAPSLARHWSTRRADLRSPGGTESRD